jgi:signal transduction histidine kinase
MSLVGQGPLPWNSDAAVAHFHVRLDPDGAPETARRFLRPRPGQRSAAFQGTMTSADCRPALMIQKSVAMVYPGFMHAISLARPGQTAGLCRFLLMVILVATGFGALGQQPAEHASSVVTNIAQLRRLSSQEAKGRYSFRLEGGVWWVNPAGRKLVLHDASGTAELEMNFSAQPVQLGQRVRLVGDGAITRRGADFRTGANGAGGASPLRLEIIGREALPDLRWIAIGQPLMLQNEDPWAEVEGEVTQASEQPDGLHLELSAMGGHLRVEVGEASGLSAAALLNRRIRAKGFCQSAFTTAGQKVPGMLLVPNRKGIEFIETPLNFNASGATNASGEPGALLTTAAAVNELKQEAAARGYPVNLQGVVICVVSNRPAFIIQDATRAVYVVVDSTLISELPEVGTYLEVEGRTDKGSFAPIVRARQIDILGLGSMPEPIQPTWDQLLNGSLDEQWVEIRGVVEEAVRHPSSYAKGWSKVILRTPGGELWVDLWLPDSDYENLESYRDAVVRLRGCFFVAWSASANQLRLGRIRLRADAITVERPAPADEFDAPPKRAAELTRFDPQASAFQRAKVSGQILHLKGRDYFMVDGTNGVRFTLRHSAELHTADLVEVVGYPELSGAAPVLRQAVARKTGHLPLPAPKNLLPEDLPSAIYDSTRVRIEGWLVSSRMTPTNRVLEIQSGSWRFLARMSMKKNLPPPPPIGSRLALVGVYVAQGGNRMLGDDAAPFDLMIHSPVDIKVLALPPWWTLPRLLAAVGALTCTLALLVLWITQLRRQVEKRTAEVAIQTQGRQRLEHQRSLEQERARIAHDLHDELGSGITEIGMLAARAKSAANPDEKRSRYLEQVGDKAREMVTALDEIVWATNPSHDSLASLVSYFCLYADRFLKLASITWRFEGPPAATELAVDSRHRHQLFLAFKEALTNVVRHSEATEVRLSIQLQPDGLHLTIADNGRGLSSGARTEEMDGVDNMRSRIEQLGGRFEITSAGGHGTTVRFQVPIQ